MIRTIPDKYQLAVIMLIAFGMKLFHSSSSTDDLMFILSPVNFLIGIFHHEPGVYLHDQGFYYEQHGIIIDKSCAGVNFFIIAFCTLGTIGLPKAYKVTGRVFQLILLIAVAYLLTLIANTSRISCAMHLIPFQNSLPFLGTKWFHEVLGSFIYLFVLISATISVHVINQKFSIRYAKLS